VKRKKKNAAPKPKVQVKPTSTSGRRRIAVSSFEKFSGPMYGRHRGYERRFYPEKDKAKVPTMIYVTRLTAKKEIHNVVLLSDTRRAKPETRGCWTAFARVVLGNYDIEK